MESEVWRESINFLAICGSTIVCVFSGDGPGGRGTERTMQVRGLEDLELQRSMRQRDDRSIRSLAVVDGELWGAVGRYVVAWGRE